MVWREALKLHVLYNNNEKKRPTGAAGLFRDGFFGTAGRDAKVGRKTRRADSVANGLDFFASVLSRVGDMVLLDDPARTAQNRRGLI